MKTIVWKELREHGFWVPLALIATSLITLRAMFSQDLLLNQLELMTPTVFAAAVIASLLGVLQSWGDRRLESRALLLHRSVTAKEAFTAKFLAGLLMHGLATLPPLIVAAIWIAIDARQTLAAYWDEMLPVMLYTLLAFMCWPATFLLVQRNAWWFGSRLFPLPCALWILAFSAASNAPNAGPEIRWIGLGVAIFAAATLYFAAYTTFVSLGQVKGAPRVSLGMLHGLSLLIAVFAAAIAIDQTYRQREIQLSTSTYHSVQLGQDGEPILVAVEQRGYQTRRTRIAKLSTERSVLEDLKESSDSDESLSELPSWYLNNSTRSLAEMIRSQSTFQVLGTLARKHAERPRDTGVDSLQLGPFGELIDQQSAVWIYVLDRRSGKILVYSEDKLLMHELTPEKATGLTRFGELADSSSWNSNFYYSRYSSARAIQPPQGDTYLVVPFEDAAYVLENDGSTVTRFFEMPDRVPLLASSKRNQFGTGTVDLGLRFRDRLVMIQPQEEPELETTPETLSVGGLSYLQTTVALPKQLVDSPLIQLARLPASRDELVALSTEGNNLYRWIRLNVAGEVLEEKTYQQPTPSTGPAYRNEPEVWIAALLPVGAFGLFAVISLSLGQGLEQFVWGYWTENPMASIAFCVFLILQTLVALALTYWACRHYRLSKLVTNRWLAASLVGGPFVGLGLMTVYTRIATQTCAVCRKKCRADRGECEHCQQALDQPSRRGIEIFDDESVDSVVTAAV